MKHLPSAARQVMPGVLVCVLAALGAAFLSGQYGAPVMLLALLLGMSMGFLATDGGCQAGIDFTARHVLRWGVALLGLKITALQVMALGWRPLVLVLVAVAATIAVSMWLARRMGFQALFGLLSGGATAICGASAAMALAAALPRHPQKERATLFTVVGVSVLSTLCMVLYPPLVRWLGLSPLDGGVFIGGTIHDVAQVVGAGYSLSTEVGDVATLVKLLRVAMLLPVILLATAITCARGGDEAGAMPPLLPGFVAAFALLLAVNSMGWVPAWGLALGADASRWCLVAAMAAIGMKTRLRELISVGLRPVALMVVETVFLAVLILGGWPLLAR